MEIPRTGAPSGNARSATQTVKGIAGGRTSVQTRMDLDDVRRNRNDRKGHVRGSDLIMKNTRGAARGINAHPTVADNSENVSPQTKASAPDSTISNFRRSLRRRSRDPEEPVEGPSTLHRTKLWARQHCVEVGAKSMAGIRSFHPARPGSAFLFGGCGSEQAGDSENSGIAAIGAGAESQVEDQEIL